MAVKVISPGLSTTVQDLGRPGYYHLGIPLSGGMDRFALRVGQYAVACCTIISICQHVSRSELDPLPQPFTCRRSQRGHIFLQPLFWLVNTNSQHFAFISKHTLTQNQTCVRPA